MLLSFSLLNYPTSLLRKLNTAAVLSLTFAFAPCVVAMKRMGVGGAGRLIDAWLHSMMSIMSRHGLRTAKLIYDPNILDMKRCVLICNHITYFDWLMVWFSLLRMKRSNNVVFCVKRNQNRLLGPVLNASMRMMRFIILDQDINEDHVRLMHRATYFRDHMDEYCFVIFPEGKLLSTGIRQKEPVLQNGASLTPRTKGFDILMRGLGESCQGVIDCNLHYWSDNGRTIETRRVPDHVRVYMRRIDIPRGIDHEQWLKEWFVDKALQLDDLRAGFDVIFIRNRRSIDLKSNIIIDKMVAAVPSIGAAILILYLFNNNQNSTKSSSSSR